MWELDCEEGWVPKNWCFWPVVLEKTLENPLDCKEIQPVHSEGDQPWDFFGRQEAKAETPVLWPPHAKSWLIGKYSDAGRDWGRRRRGWQRMRWLDEWHHWLDGHEFEWTPGVGDGHGGLACCSSWGHKESDTTEWLNWTDGTRCHDLSFLSLSTSENSLMHVANLHLLLNTQLKCHSSGEVFMALTRQLATFFWCPIVKMKSLSRVRLFEIPWTVVYQASLSMGFSRQEYWSGLPFPSPEDLPVPGIKPRPPALQADALPSEPPGKPNSTL